jgi:hypothetical protein
MTKFIIICAIDDCKDEYGNKISDPRRQHLMLGSWFMRQTQIDLEVFDEEEEDIKIGEINIHFDFSIEREINDTH